MYLQQEAHSKATHTSSLGVRESTGRHSVVQCVVVCRIVLQCVAGSVLQYVAVCCGMMRKRKESAGRHSVLQFVAVCCCVLHFVAVCCRQRVAVCCSILHCVAVCCRQCVAVCCSMMRKGTGSAGRHFVLQCVAVCCSMLQCVAVYCSELQHGATCRAKEMALLKGQQEDNFALQCDSVRCSVFKYMGWLRLVGSLKL